MITPFGNGDVGGKVLPFECNTRRGGVDFTEMEGLFVAEEGLRCHGLVFDTALFEEAVFCVAYLCVLSQL